MSKKQWGHGYYAGKEAAESGGIKKYIVTMTKENKPHIHSLYRILRKNEDVITVEDISDCLTVLFLTGSALLFQVADKQDEIDYNYVFETTENDLEEEYGVDIKYFSNSISVKAFILNDFKQWLKEQ